MPEETQILFENWGSWAISVVFLLGFIVYLIRSTNRREENCARERKVRDDQMIKMMDKSDERYEKVANNVSEVLRQTTNAIAGLKRND